MSNDVNPNESGGKKYVAPEAARLGNVSAGRGLDCSPSGSGAKSDCTTMGSSAQACISGLITGGNGECSDGQSAGPCGAGSSPRN